jgi:ligand-binding sensor domain-containing protein
MVNALVSTPRGLYVATGRGLFVLRDDGRLHAVKALRERGTNGLAFDGRSLFVTTPGALHRLRIDGGPPTRSWWMPAGSRSLQKVAVGRGRVWLASEDRGAILGRRQGRSYRFEAFDRMAGLPSSWTLDISVDARGHAHVATLRDGLVTIDGRGRVRRVSSSIEPWLLHVSHGARGLWVGSQDGAALLGPEGKTLALSDLPDGRVYAIEEHQAMLYVATEVGLLQRPLAGKLDGPAPQPPEKGGRQAEVGAQRGHTG